MHLARIYVSIKTMAWWWRYEAIMNSMKYEYQLFTNFVHSRVSTATVEQVSNQSARLNLGLHLANERRRYKVTPSLIGWTHTYSQPWKHDELLLA